MGQCIRYLVAISLLSMRLFPSTTHLLHFFNFSSFPRKPRLLFPFQEKPLHFYFKISIISLHSLFPNITYFSSAFFFFVCLNSNSHRLGKLLSPISPKILTFSFTHFIKHLVCITLNTKFMAPKVKKGKNVVGTSSSRPVSSVSLLHPTCRE